jgi:hypothetical protein
VELDPALDSTLDYSLMFQPEQNIHGEADLMFDLFQFVDDFELGEIVNETKETEEDEVDLYFGIILE